MGSARVVDVDHGPGDRWTLLESCPLRELVDASPCASPRDGIAGVVPPCSALDRLLERVLVARDALRLLQRAGADGDGVTRAQRAVDAAVTHCRRSAFALDAGAASATSTLLGLVRDAEVEVRMVDRDLPMDSCALGQIESTMPKSWLARMARMLAPLTADNGDARDRYEFLVTRLLRLRGPSGFILLPWEAVRVALDYVAPAELCTCADQVRASAVTHLGLLKQRIQATSSIDQLFSEGLYSEIYGYKLTLRGDLVDPEILYAVAALNTAICERLQWQAVRSRSTAPLLKRIAEAEIQVRTILSGQPWRADLRQRFQFARLRGRAPSPAARSATSRTMPAVGALSLLRRRRISARTSVLVALISVVVLAAAAWPLLGSTPYRTTALQGAPLWELSPMLQRGMLLDDQQVFLGDVDPVRWDRLDDDLRRHEASLMMRALRARSVRVAVLHRQGRVVCEIDARGDVTLWPPTEVTPPGEPLAVLSP